MTETRSLSALIELWRKNAAKQETERGDAAWTAGYVFKRCADELSACLPQRKSLAELELMARQEFESDPHDSGCQSPHGGRCSCGWDLIAARLEELAGVNSERVKFLQQGVRFAHDEDRQRMEAILEKLSACLPQHQIVELVEDFCGWWHLNREGSVNAAYARIDKFTKEVAGLTPPPTPARQGRNHWIASLAPCFNNDEVVSVDLRSFSGKIVATVTRNEWLEAREQLAALTPHPEPELRATLQAIVDDAVGERRDPLWIVQRDLIIAAARALEVAALTSPQAPNEPTK